MKEIVENPNQVRSAELVVGIPSFNEADSIDVPTDMVGRGLADFFPQSRAVIVNVDNDSQDGTRDVFFRTPTRAPKIYVSTPPGVRGKGNNLRNLFRVAVELDARAVVVVDADLKSITPHWVRYLAEPLLGRFDYVSPIYVRHKYDGTITNHIAYPLLRTLFGLRVRQPIGGDFGFSGRLARAFLVERLWNDRIASFGIDVWMTTIAIARRFNVCQAFLGAPKTHRPKDPSSDLSHMFTDVVGTLFDLMIEFEYLWKESGDSRPSSIYGFGLGVDEKPPAVNVDIERLCDGFRSGFERFGDLWRRVIPPSVFTEIERLQECRPIAKFHYPSDLWARVLFNFAVAYKNESEDRTELLAALVPFYHSRVLSYVNSTVGAETREAEEYLENINRVFEEEKYYLVDRWDASANHRESRLLG